MSDPDTRRAARDERPPRFCPECRIDLGEHPYTQRVSSPWAARIERFGGWILLPMAVVVLTLLLGGHLPRIHVAAAGYLLLAMIGLPSLACHLVASCFRRDVRMICLRCSWYRDFPGPR